MTVATSTSRQALFQQGHYAVRLESLSNQVSKQSAERRVVGNLLACAQALAERGVEERILIQCAKDLVNRLPRGGRQNAGLLDLLADAQLSSPLP